ncbi:FxDxF family PEP-CTERM protein [Erythrobacter sp. QSSC1-22B]|uniref:FxDxF family PEP-CTERM protein n=1 Tax=Erythrobacter sp. QSSC1-22B TaxID=1860125 RepID=UPI0009F2ED97|nr:FxDxF family PEP-CTERM protein [Erythrobacter sp. QSSC1-22B]
MSFQFSATKLKAMAAASACVLAVAAQPASAEVFVPNTGGIAADGSSYSFIVTGNPFAGPVSGAIARSNLPASAFSDVFNFTLGQDGLGSGSVTTTLAGSLGGSTDVDFTSVSFFNGFNNFIVPIGGTGSFEFAEAINIPIFTGVLNTLTVNGVGRGQGSYGGQLSFQPSAPVPEPGTWALMLLGFGAIGFAMRRRKEQVRVNYAF